jgi:excinuclease ABC subunit C
MWDESNIATLPDLPGVYLMKDAQGRIFYIGKAKSLRDRLRSYFSGTDTRFFVGLLQHLLADLEVILTHNAKEALLLENSLVKQHKPRFNVKLIDDKNFLCLRLDIKQPYPRIEVVRRSTQDGAKYFGPYDSASAIRETLRLINRHFQLRTCSDHVLNNRARPCLQYQIKRCPAPCVYDLSHGEYTQNVRNVVAFLDGHSDDLIKDLQARMREKSGALEYEAAAGIRDQLKAVEHSLIKQRMISHDRKNRDIVGIFREGPNVEIHVMRTRGGSLIDAKRFSFDTELPTSEVLAHFSTLYFTQEGLADVADEILFPKDMEWASALQDVLSEKYARKISVLVPQKGDKLQLVELANRNAQQAYVDKQRQEGSAQTAMESLQRALHLKRVPEHVECFDISHLQGNQIVASVVHFERGVPKKEMYRHYKIRSTTTQDDFRSMYEVLHRRLQRGLEEGNLPDLLIIDGGKGQLNAAYAALEDHGVDDIDLVSLAKSRVQDEVQANTLVEPDSEILRSPERVFVLGQKDPIVLKQNSAELFLLVRARDEAHRFAISFHRNLRQKSASRSVLDDIPGVGPARRKALLRAFGSVTQIRQASPEDLTRVVGKKMADAIIKGLGL